MSVMGLSVRYAPWSMSIPDFWWLHKYDVTILDDGSAAISDPTIYKIAFHEYKGNYNQNTRARYTPPTFYCLPPEDIINDDFRELVMKADIYVFAMSAVEVRHTSSIMFQSFNSSPLDYIWCSTISRYWWRQIDGSQTGKSDSRTKQRR